MDARNAAAARASAVTLGLDGVEVVTGDASVTTAYEGAVPADLVLLCGVFGHATDEDIRHTVRHLPTLCAPGATVIWTRGRSTDDRRPTIQRWFVDEGFETVAFDHDEASGWGVGTDRLVAPPRPYQPGVRLFTFHDVRPPSPG